ncbi:16S rRNA (uracil(1498)-N(3))-methyltransferase [Aquimarina gracilis]|uniref:Ribosomal RNA small subunit methyltransferase E n=1 Tax=Aquimarina gracilis TaxID=874422 RepID=A0ABU6A2C2_9FLAO|nr:16S rRNA (uracil(1498)-N(3))-methyltransferase [Aquimarina gracilis]MEB3348325.1 16S rRNA (uracil(1498)-N(3))-methyltransferase [Aquimarina gracilis]
MQLFYNNTLTKSSTEIKFSREESKHIAKVLRKKEGDALHITNGKGHFFIAKITFSNPSQCHATIDSVETQSKKPYQLHLAVAPTKMNDRYEWFLEKATEIGIDQITPIFCDHSERKVIKAERFERILQSAMKQSLQAYLPRLNPAISLSDFLEKNNTDTLFIAHCEETQKQSIKDVLLPKTNITILIGPEGDFSPKEIQTALSKGYKPVTLGNTRLRTETAAIVAAHSVAFINS